MAVQPQNSNLNYLIDPTFTKLNRLFVLSFTRNARGDLRDYFLHYYVPNVEIKDFNVLFDGKRFFDLPVKSKKEGFEKVIDMSRKWLHNWKFIRFCFFQRKLQTNSNWFK